MPIIIHGSRGITGIKKRGLFHCPHCATRVNYVWKHVRRWGTLYFIPIIPGQVLGEYVECQACMNTYKPEVLEHDPAAAARAFEAAYRSGMKRVMVRLMLADGSIDEPELQLIRGVFRNLTGAALDEAELQAEIETARRDRTDVAASLRELGGMLNDKGKAAVFKAAYLVAAANGTIDRAEVDLLNRVGAALGLTVEQAQQAVREINQPPAR